MSEAEILSKVFNIIDVGRPDMSVFENRMKYQHIVYLIQLYDLSLGYGFLWNRGPYSRELYSTLEYIYKNPEIYNKSEELKFNNNDKVLDELHKFRDHIIPKINDALYLDIITSLHYVRIQIFTKQVSIDILTKRFFESRPSFKNIENIQDIIKEAYDDLKFYEKTSN
jgi:hypothetical protein